MNKLFQKAKYRRSCRVKWFLWIHNLWLISTVNDRSAKAKIWHVNPLAKLWKFQTWCIGESWYLLTNNTFILPIRGKCHFSVLSSGRFNHRKYLVLVQAPTKSVMTWNLNRIDLISYLDHNCFFRLTKSSHLCNLVWKRFPNFSLAEIGTHASK